MQGGFGVEQQCVWDSATPSAPPRPAPARLLSPPRGGGGGLLQSPLPSLGVHWALPTLRTLCLAPLCGSPRAELSGLGPGSPRRRPREDPRAGGGRGGGSCASCVAWDSGGGQKAVEKGSPGRKGTGERGTGDERRKDLWLTSLAVCTPTAGRAAGQPGREEGDAGVAVVGKVTASQSLGLGDGCDVTQHLPCLR